MKFKLLVSAIVIFAIYIASRESDSAKLKRLMHETDQRLSSFQETSELIGINLDSVNKILDDNGDDAQLAGALRVLSECIRNKQAMQNFVSKHIGETMMHAGKMVQGNTALFESKEIQDFEGWRPKAEAKFWSIVNMGPSNEELMNTNNRIGDRALKKLQNKDYKPIRFTPNGFSLLCYFCFIFPLLL